MAGRRRPVRPPSPLDAPFVVRRHEAERGQSVYGNLMQELSYYHTGTSNEAVHKQEVIKWSPENKGDHGQLDRGVGDSSSLKGLLTGAMARHVSPVRSPSPLERALERRHRKSIQGRPVPDNPGQGPSHSDPDAPEPANKAKIAKNVTRGARKSSQGSRDTLRRLRQTIGQTPEGFGIRHLSTPGGNNVEERQTAPRFIRKYRSIGLLLRIVSSFQVKFTVESAQLYAQNCPQRPTRFRRLEVRAASERRPEAT
ncbi:hypothetical protein PIIN_11512 [Serendipita indica DSM 11827]|uniref:Uncharacterized protein n=1 Tax=Serendipita indica (strain DSM 11827) TaxID=1109443 RepID=G4U1U2_SERID|nr:hypothetical protein PIIN_11512 [Serendipita indica DSM 11827]